MRVRKIEKFNLQDLRKEIDRIDKRIVRLISERFKITKKIGIFKRDYGLPFEDLEREKEIFNKSAFLAEKLGFCPELIKNIFKLIIKETKKEYKRFKKT